MRNLFRAYRVLAIIVGILLTVLAFVAMPLKYLAAEGSTAAHRGEQLTSIVGVAHGWIYMAYLLVAFALARRARWPLGYMIGMLVAGLLPIVIFVVERMVSRRLLSENPTLDEPASA